MDSKALRDNPFTTRQEPFGKLESFADEDDPGRPRPNFDPCAGAVVELGDMFALDTAGLVTEVDASGSKELIELRVVDVDVGCSAAESEWRDCSALPA